MVRWWMVDNSLSTIVYPIQFQTCNRTKHCPTSVFYSLPPIDSMFTTNEEDQREAARLQKRLQDAQDDDSLTGATDSGYRIPNVSIDSGTHKYVLISAIIPGGGERQQFVVSRRGAEYHRNAAEPFVEALEGSGYLSIQILGGGRIAFNEKQKSINIYGYSYGFGLADHAMSKSVVQRDARFKEFEITWSNEGY